MHKRKDTWEKHHMAKLSKDLFHWLIGLTNKFTTIKKTLFYFMTLLTRTCPGVIYDLNNSMLKNANSNKYHGSYDSAVRPYHNIWADTPGCLHWADRAEARTEWWNLKRCSADAVWEPQRALKERHTVSELAFMTVTTWGHQNISW